MDKNMSNDEVQKVELDQLQKIQNSLNNITNKKSKFLFVLPESQNPVASVYEIYFHATVVKKMGYSTHVLVEKGDYVIPSWIEKELTDHNHIALTDPKLTVGPEDVMVIPDVFSNIMEQTKNLPCVRVGLLQSIDYMVNALLPGMDWSSFGIQEIIATSPMLKEWVEMFYGKKFNISTYDIGIPDYFEKSKLPQKPVISIIGRNPNEISKIVKLFFSRYPQYRWVTFDTMVTQSKPPQAMRRKDFAKRLQNNFAAVWVDRISSFGTFPLECMRSGVIPIALKPDLIPEYIVKRDKDGNAVQTIDGLSFWTSNFYDIPLLIGEVLVKWLDDKIDESIYDNMDEISSKYTQENSEKQIVKIYESIINNRVNLFNEALQINKANNNIEPPVL